MFPSSPTWHKVVAPLQIFIDILTSRELEKNLDPSYTWVDRDINLAEILGEGKWGGGINQGQHSGGSQARLGLQVPHVSCVIVGKWANLSVSLLLSSLILVKLSNTSVI